MNNLYELNTAIWLSRLSSQSNKKITLADIPGEELDRIADLNMDCVWLMGVWERSPVSAQISQNDSAVTSELQAALPDFTPKDVIGSAYSIRSYCVDQRFGGNSGLAMLRTRLQARNIKLILDYVPNHTAFDHEWASEHAEYYITSHTPDPLRFRDCSGIQIAYGSDPTLAPWNDVAQLNVFNPGCRRECTQTMLRITDMCDGVRCDMAMLLLNRIFSKTWGKLAGHTPSAEYWTNVISAARQKSPEFIFIAECYWDTESELINLGFDYCYDKELYDQMVAGSQDGISAHLANSAKIAPRLIHFLENHDEQRAATIFSTDQQISYAELLTSLPGPKLWHDGQFEGHKIKASVHASRTTPEAVNPDILARYQALLHK